MHFIYRPKVLLSLVRKVLSKYSYIMVRPKPAICWSVNLPHLLYIIRHCLPHKNEISEPKRHLETMKMLWREGLWKRRVSLQARLNQSWLKKHS